jgi:hypothetical protein
MVSMNRSDLGAVLYLGIVAVAIGARAIWSGFPQWVMWGIIILGGLVYAVVGLSGRQK